MPPRKPPSKKANSGPPAPPPLVIPAATTKKLRDYGAEAMRRAEKMEALEELERTTKAAGNRETLIDRIAREDREAGAAMTDPLEGFRLARR